MVNKMEKPNTKNLSIVMINLQSGPTEIWKIPSYKTIRFDLWQSESSYNLDISWSELKSLLFIYCVYYSSRFCYYYLPSDMILNNAIVMHKV